MPPLLYLRDMTWTEVRDLDLAKAVALLPIGAVEAHGPHLPLCTDPIIAEAMAEAGGKRLLRRDLTPIVLPTLEYTAASFAAAFPGTLSLRPETVSALITDLGTSLERHGIRVLALVNSHLDPAHLGSLYAAANSLRRTTELTVVFPDITRKPWALRLSDEFKSGACHAGRYEGSVVLARRPDLVREARRAGLDPNPSSLSTAIRQGLDSFEAAGGPLAYFGDPAAATAEEGRETIESLGGILEEAVLSALDEATNTSGVEP